jgi:Zn-dependent peptidase ImmA (M78 family)
MDASDIKCRRLDKEDIWRIADNIRNQHWPESTLPVDIEKIIESRLHLTIEPLHNIRKETDMDAFLRIDRKGIIVDYDMYINDKYLNRMRFSFAHELGHYLLHKYIYDDIDFQVEEEWRSCLLGVSPREYKNFEWQANEFAGRLLVPRNDLMQEIEKVITLIKELKLIEYLKADPDAVLAIISPAISKKMGVSDEVIERRADREKLWPPEI